MTQPTNQPALPVRLREVMQQASPGTLARMTLPLFLGKDGYGEPVVADLASMPHCLIAGAAGSGKSNCISAMLMSILRTQTPEDVKVMLIDPRIEERPSLKQLPHLLWPVITDAASAIDAVDRAYEVAEHRHLFLSRTHTRNIAGYNSLTDEERLARLQATTKEQQAKVPKHLPRIVIIIEGFTDQMLTFDDADEAIFSPIGQLLQRGRVAGIHLILSTQRPQAISPELKANIPCRIAFRTASRQASRSVFDEGGAELLSNPGDMLFLPSGADRPIRAQGALVSDSEVLDAIRQAMTNHT